MSQGVTDSSSFDRGACRLAFPFSLSSLYIPFVLLGAGVHICDAISQYAAAVFDRPPPAIESLQHTLL